MRDRPNESLGSELPRCAADFIGQVTKKIRYRRKVRQEVQAELTSHFEDELRDCADAQEREKRAQRLIEGFGDAKLLAVLCRRAKKRCRPLWARMCVRTMQAAGVFLLVFIPYTIWFISGKPNPTIDYLPQLNALHRPSGPAKDNAWPYYERAMRLVVEPNETIRDVAWFKSFDPPEKPLTPKEREVLQGWIAVNSLAWLQLEFAATRGHCHRVYRRVSGTPALSNSMDDPLVARLRIFIYLGLWRARLAIEQGHVDEACGHCLTLVQVGAHWQEDAYFVTELIGHLICVGAEREILRTMAATNLSASQLSELQARLIKIYRDGYPLVNFDGERLVMLDMIQRTFTNEWFGGGHCAASCCPPEVKETLRSSDAEMSAVMDVLTSPIGMALSMIHASRNKTVAKINQMYDRMNKTRTLSPYERRNRGIVCMTESMGRIEKLRYALVWLLTPDERKVSEFVFRARAEYEALVTVIALKRYRLEKGSYPLDLGTLVRDRCIAKLPMDPYSDAPLVYRPTSNDFTLYSVGRNFTDDGGEPGRDKEDRPKLWADKGDVVFWPVGP